MRDLLPADRPVLILAPMQDVTDLPFMRVMERFGGPDVYVSEYFRVYETSRLNPYILRSIDENPTGKPVFALVKTGDRIRVSVSERSINIQISDEELAERKANWTPPKMPYARGYGWMFSQHIKQAHEGCDFDFLESQFGDPVDEPAIF